MPMTPSSAAAAAAAVTAARPLAAAGEADAPAWEEDFKAEKEFRESPQFRSLAALHETRQRLWSSERRWLQDIAGRSEAAVGKIQLQRREQEKLERATQEE